MNSFRIINESSAEWNEILKNSISYDFYHTQFYHCLENLGKPTMLIATCKESFIALPLIIRTIEGCEYKDATSVYGYCGPISNLDFRRIDMDLLNYFREQLRNYFIENNIISVFSRLHPLLDQNNVFEGLGELVDLNKTVSIDLSVPINEQRRVFRKSLKSELNQLRRFDFTVKESKNKQEVDVFIDIYHSTMEKLEASERYYFNRDYFHSFLENREFESKLLLAIREGEIVAGAIFTIVGNIMQYHLAGTKQEFARQAPMKLILDEARLLGNSLNLQYLHLGGGVGGEDNDSLFRFKSGFSKDFYQFTIWKWIIDAEKYNELIKRRSLENSESDFFPLYRISEQ